MNAKPQPQIEIKSVNSADGAFGYQDMAMSKDPALAIAGRMLKIIHNAQQDALCQETERPGGLHAQHLLNASTTIAANVLCELVQFAARGRYRREDRREVCMAVAEEFEHQARALALALMATAAEYRKIATG